MSATAHHQPLSGRDALTPEEEFAMARDVAAHVYALLPAWERHGWLDPLTEVQLDGDEHHTGEDLEWLLHKHARTLIEGLQQDRVLRSRPGH
jgi:hypothetical protein